MKITMLWIQRTCSYDGEFLPELMYAVDEITDEQNYELLNAKYKAMCEKIGNGFDAVRLIETEIDDDDLLDAMEPAKIKNNGVEVV